MERDTIITEFRLIDEYGNETKLSKETTIEGTENGTDIHFIYKEFIMFLQSAGFGESTIAKIQYIEAEE